jgi:glutamate-1-semialdehyde 2,1-aminomutase
LARAYTGKQKILRFEGHYHGWFDNVALGLGAKDVSELGSREHPDVPLWSEGLPERIKEEIILRPWNDLDLVKATVEKNHHEIAAIVTEPVMCNSGCIPPKPGFLEGLRELCDHYGILLIFDEVITGFRLSMGGAQAHFGITPDLGIFGKAMASGYPISALVGKASIMKLISEGRVIHAGTMNSNNPCIAAAMATIEILEAENTHQKLYSLGMRLMDGIREAARATGQNLRVQGMGPMFHTGFSHLEASVDYRDTLALDKAKGSKFVAGLQNRGVRIIGRGLWYISNAHTEAEIDQTIATVHTVLKEDF